MPGPISARIISIATAVVDRATAIDHDEIPLVFDSPCEAISDFVDPSSELVLSIQGFETIRNGH
jgi:hypothetical protein